MFDVRCKNCGKGQLIEGGDVHEAVDAAGCTCCPLGHHHGEAANAGLPCRPLLITVMGPVDDEDPGAPGRLEVLGLVTEDGQALP